MRTMTDLPTKCSLVSCVHNLAYGGGPPDERRCNKKGGTSGWAQKRNVGTPEKPVVVPCGKVYESGVR